MVTRNKDLESETTKTSPNASARKAKKQNFDRFLDGSVDGSEITVDPSNDVSHLNSAILQMSKNQDHTVPT